MRVTLASAVIMAAVIALPLAQAQDKTNAPGLIARPSCNLSEITRASRAVIGPEVTDLADISIIGGGVPSLCSYCPTTTIGMTRQKRDRAAGKAAELAAALVALERLREAVLACEALGY